MSLRKDGYGIDSSTNRGYMLTSRPDRLDAGSIGAFLSDDRMSDVTVLPVVDSTNTYCKDLAGKGAPQGTVVISDCQTGGKGRRGRSFLSPSGVGLYLSYIMRPESGIEKISEITCWTAVAVCDAIKEAYGLDSSIKWVNDVYVNGKKTCGILTEAAVGIEQGGLDYVVIGFGVNVNNYNFPDELKETATSLRAEVGESVSRAKLAAEILNILEEKIGTIGDRSFLEEYRRRSILTGKTVDIENNGITERFECVGIDDLGKLIVRRRSGEELTLSSGTVKIVNG
jgi:BirA family biotin operon repressor/biotin-[acetyl-CoA-carboxylase] ligase